VIKLVLLIVICLSTASCLKREQDYRAEIIGNYYGVSNCAPEAGSMSVSATNDENELIFHDPHIGNIRALVNECTLVIPYQYYYLEDHALFIQGIGMISRDCISIKTNSQDLMGGVGIRAFIMDINSLNLFSKII
jgi:hypothetical protein